jgi:putative ABC transport system substrate-binding protein
MFKLALRFAIVMLAVLAQPVPQAVAKDKTWHIGFLDVNPPPTPDRPSWNLKFFREGLSQLGYDKGRDYVIDARFADTDRSRLPALAKELVDRNVDVIVTIGTVTTRAAKAATATIPIVMAGANDPVANGFVASLAHPGGNVTGLTRFPPGLLGKSLQLFKDVAPDISRLAVLGADFPESGLQAAAGKLNIAVLGHDTTDVKSVDEFNEILLQIAEEHVDTMFVMSNFTNEKYRKQLF